MVRGKCPSCGGKTGFWAAAVSLGRDADGNRKRKTIYGATRAEVVAEVAKVMTLAQSGPLMEPTRLTVVDYMTQWLTHAKTTVELHTWVSYEQVVRIHIVPALGHVPVAQLQPLQIQGLYQDRLDAGRSPRTVRRIHEVLHNALAQAVEWQLIAQNPASRVKPPRAGKREMQFLTFDQAQQLLRALDGHPLESLHLAAIMTGMREGELLGLRWSDIDWSRQTLTVAQTVWIHQKQPIFKPYPKNRKPRTLPLATAVLAKLKTHRVEQAKQILAATEYEDHGLVWARKNGQPLRHEYVLRNLHRALRQTGLPEIRYHDLRHSAASLLLALGVPLKEVSETLGHSSVEITADLYGHLLPDAQRQSVQKLEERLLGKKASSSS